MKRITPYTVFCNLILLFILISCKNDDEISRNFGETKLVNNPILGKTTLNPQNPANIYDSIGIYHNYYLEKFWDNFSEPGSINETITIINNLLGLNPSIMSGNLPLQQKVQDIIDNPVEEFDLALQQVLNSSDAQEELIEFLDYLESNKHQEFSLLYSFITDFEEKVLNDPQYSTHDKRILLSFSSFIRHGVFLKKRRDDKDWDISIASKTGALLGADVDSQNVVYWTLIIGISQYTL